MRRPRVTIWDYAAAFFVFAAMVGIYLSITHS